MTVPELGGVAFARAVAKSRKVGLIPEHRNIGEILMFGNLEDTAKTGHSARPPSPISYARAENSDQTGKVWMLFV
jgi:hypothetical protein